MPPRFLLGLTGNIACGKSSVGRLLVERFGAEYLDADEVVHQLYAAGSAELDRIKERFGPGVVRADGSVDRRRLGDLVMADKIALRDLEAILIPSVRRIIDERIARSRAEVLVLDAIKLVESGLADRCQGVWVVTCDRDAQVRRLMEHRAFTEAEARARVEAQAPQEEKLRRATTVVENRGDLDQLEREVERAWSELLPRL